MITNVTIKAQYNSNVNQVYLYDLSESSNSQNLLWRTMEFNEVFHMFISLMTYFNMNANLQDYFLFRFQRWFHPKVSLRWIMI
jgi:hypothetical protein